MKFCRLVNILNKESNDFQEIWKAVNTTRQTFLSQNPDPKQKNTEIMNMLNPNLLFKASVKENILEIENKLNVAADTMTQPNVSKETLQAAAEMFTYLNYSPPKLLVFFRDLFKQENPKNILLALSSIVKVSQNAAKESSRKILQNTLKVLKISNLEKIDALAGGLGFSDLADSTVLGLLSYAFQPQITSFNLIQDPKS